MLSKVARFSGFSLAAAVLVVLALAIAVLALWVGVHSPTMGPAEGAATLFIVATSLITAWCCTLLGTIFGWIGWRRETSARRWVWTIAFINSVLCLSPLLFLLVSCVVTAVLDFKASW
jgi:hypothetical protein